MMNALGSFTLACVVAGGPLAVASSAQSSNQGDTYAQQLVDWLVASNADVTAVELAVLSDSGCATLAATDPDDVGEACDEDERIAMRAGAHVERPSAHENAYDITQALHDVSGKLIGAVGFDILPAPEAGDSVVLTRARALLGELEARIPSKASLSGPAR